MRIKEWHHPALDEKAESAMKKCHWLADTDADIALSLLFDHNSTTSAITV